LRHAARLTRAGVTETREDGAFADPCLNPGYTETVSVCAARVADDMATPPADGTGCEPKTFYGTGDWQACYTHAHKLLHL